MKGTLMRAVVIAFIGVFIVACKPVPTTAGSTPSSPTESAPAPWSSPSPGGPGGGAVADQYVAFVVNYATPGRISTRAIDPATGALKETIKGASLATGVYPGSIAVDPKSQFVYVLNGGNANTAGTISVYILDSTTGTLAEIAGSPIAAGASPTCIAVDPTGKFAYVAHFFDSNVSAYMIDRTTGALTAIAGSSLAAPRPGSMTFDPTGKFAYVVNSIKPGFVSVYTVDFTTGALTEIAGSPFAAGKTPFSIAVNPTGKFAYVTNLDDNTVSAYTVDCTTGALTEIAGSPFAAGKTPFSIAVDPTGKFAYIGDDGIGGAHSTISAYTIDSSTGALTEIAGSPFDAPHPGSMTFDPRGKFVYTAGSWGVCAYAIDSTTGALTAITGSPFQTGGSSCCMATVKLW